MSYGSHQNAVLLACLGAGHDCLLDIVISYPPPTPAITQPDPDELLSHLSRGTHSKTTSLTSTYTSPANSYGIYRVYIVKYGTFAWYNCRPFC